VGQIASAQVLIVDNGGLEDGWFQEAWSFYDNINAGTLCDTEWCGLAGFDEGPHSGDFWINLGAITSQDRVQEVTQMIAIPEGSTTLSFWLQKGSAGDVIGWLEVKLDDTVLYREDVPPAIPKQGYQQHSFDISAFADGEEHVLMLRSETDAGLGGVDWHVDDVEVKGCELEVDWRGAAKAADGTYTFDVRLDHQRMDAVTVPMTATLSDTRGWVVASWTTDAFELVYQTEMEHTFRIEVPEELRDGDYVLELCVDAMSGGRQLCESVEFLR